MSDARFPVSKPNICMCAGSLQIQERRNAGSQGSLGGTLVYKMTPPSIENSVVFSARISKPLADAADARLRQLGISRQNALTFAVSLFAELSKPEVRAVLAPAMRTLSADPKIHALLDSGLLMALRFHTECPGALCPVPALRTAPVTKPAPAKATRAAEPCACPDSDETYGMSEHERKAYAELETPAARKNFADRRRARREAQARLKASKEAERARIAKHDSRK